MLKEVRQMHERELVARDCSFQPVINDLSRAITAGTREEGGVEETLIRYG